ncbi:hypothetical protein [Shewanella algae]|uniref:hypothetical protein n=1 Tax=Shewanella algae TaxID=38313 RepID=UPI0030051E75
MNLSIREKLALQRRNKDLIQQLKEEKLPLRQKLQMQAEVSANFKKLKAKGTDSRPVPEPTTENELLNKYLAGEFNEQPAEKLFEVIDKLDSQGISLQQIKAGAITWVTANADLKAA